MRAAALGILILLLAAPCAAASVAVGNVKTPERTAADHPFPVSLTLHNTGPARTVTLLAALYDYGSEACGPATDPRFRTFTHVTQERVRLPADGQVQFPPAGRSWLHRYTADEIPERDTLELCIFVAAAEEAGPQIQYEAYASVPLSVRRVNQPPTGDFSWSPTAPAATDDVLFVATGADPDGDTLSYRWDFGHANASGRAVAPGERATHFFYPEGAYVVTLIVSDGIVETPLEKGIQILPASGVAEGEVPAVAIQPGADTPLTWWIPVLAVGMALLWRRR